MQPAEAWARLQGALAPHAGKVQWTLDDLGGAVVFVALDLTHLEADALNDRLHAWIRRDVERVLPHASAFVSFRHARPATLDKPELGVQAEWLDLEATFRLEMDRPRATDEDLLAFAALVPAFLERVHAAGRPEGWRDVDMGNAE